MSSSWQKLATCLFLALGAALPACDRDTPAGGSRRLRREPVRVVAGPYVVAAIAKAVGGEHVSIDWLRENDQPPDALDPDPDRRAKVGRGEIIVTTSDLLWMFPPDGSGQKLVRLDHLVPDAAPATTQPTTDSASPSAAGYLWLDPAVAKRLAARLAHELALIEPGWRSDLDANLERFEQSIAGVVADFTDASQSSTTSVRPFLSIDPEFHPFARAFNRIPVELPGGRAIGLPISDSDRRMLLALAEEHKVEVLFVPVETPRGMVLDLKAAVGDALRLENLDAFGSSAGNGRNTYEQVLRYNLEQLRKASASTLNR